MLSNRNEVWNKCVIKIRNELLPLVAKQRGGRKGGEFVCSRGGCKEVYEVFIMSVLGRKLKTDV